VWRAVREPELLSRLAPPHAAGLVHAIEPIEARARARGFVTLARRLGEIRATGAPAGATPVTRAS
jgi:hypothetical protein